MPQKKATGSSGGSEESAAKHRTKKARTSVPGGETPREHCTDHKADLGSKQTSKAAADASLSGDMAHDRPAKEADTAKDFQESDSNETAHAKEENEEVKDAELLIQRLNDLGIGEDVSVDDFNAYFDQLPYMPRIYPDAVELTGEELDKQVVRLALYRFRSYRHKVKEEGKDDTLGLQDISDDECDRQFLKKWGYFKQIEENWTLDWVVLSTPGGVTTMSSFVAMSLKKSMPITARNYSSNYSGWKGYLGARRPSYKWDCITSRGAFQAMKIAATTFPKISASLAYYGYHECIASMGYDSFWFKELDDVYFEVWQRLTKGTMSFREALEEVYNLDRFPLRQHRMKVALEDDYIMGRMKSEYRACTAAITPEVKEDGAKALIAEGIRKRINKPKYYVEYIRKKIHIARIVGIIPPH